MAAVASRPPRLAGGWGPWPRCGTNLSDSQTGLAEVRPEGASRPSCVDLLWRLLPQNVAAHRQAPALDAACDAAEAWGRTRSPTEALRKVGFLAERFWRRDLLTNFWLPT